MKLYQKLTLVAAGLSFASLASAQYTSESRRDAYGYRPVQSGETIDRWEVDAGVGYLFNTNLYGADDGVSAHVAGYYLEPLTSTNETLLKFGGEFAFGNASSNKAGDPELNTYFGSVNVGLVYRFSRHFEAGVTGGVGFGGATYRVSGHTSSTSLFGFNVRPEMTAWINDTVGLSLSYRFFQSVAMANSWSENPRQQSVELAVKVRF